MSDTRQRQRQRQRGGVPMPGRLQRDVDSHQQGDRAVTPSVPSSTPLRQAAGPASSSWCDVERIRRRLTQRWYSGQASYHNSAAAAAAADNSTAETRQYGTLIKTSLPNWHLEQTAPGTTTTDRRRGGSLSRLAASERRQTQLTDDQVLTS